MPVRFSAVVAPLLLLGYSILRLIGKAGGNYQHGFAWNLGHVFFLGAVVLLAVLAAGLRDMTPQRLRTFATVTFTASLVGTLDLIWMTLDDLFSGMRRDLPFDGTAATILPALLEFGLVTLLAVLATVRPRQLPWWSPVVVLAGFLSVGASLDLLPFGALVVFGGLSPLLSQRRILTRV